VEKAGDNNDWKGCAAQSAANPGSTAIKAKRVKKC
jgi:hypothetical protein